MTAVFRYNPATNITTGYIFTDFNDDDESLKFLTYMPHQFLASPHPLIIPALINEIALEKEMAQVSARDRELQILTHATGYSDDRDIEWAEDLGHQEPTDYRALVKRVGEEQAYFLANSTALSVTKMAIQSHLKFLKRLEKCLPLETRKSLARSSMQLSDRLEYILSGVEQALVHGSVEYRFKSLQTVVCTRVAKGKLNACQIF